MLRNEISRVKSPENIAAHQHQDPGVKSLDHGKFFTASVGKLLIAEYFPIYVCIRFLSEFPGAHLTVKTPKICPTIFLLRNHVLESHQGRVFWISLEEKLIV